MRGIESNSIFGDSLALDALDGVEQENTEECYVADVHCQRCGTPRRIEIPWAELHCIAKGKFPQQVSQGFSRWVYDKRFGKLYPDLHCDCETNPIVPLGFTPSDAARHLQNAIGSNVIGASQMNIIRQINQALANSPR